MRITYPYRQKPIGKAQFNKGNPFLDDMVLCMLFNEFGGERIFDYKRQTAYQFDQTNTPAWRGEGVEFNANREHINGPALNSILPSGSDGTILIKQKNTVTPASYFYAFTVGDGFQIFTLNWDNGASGTDLNLNNVIFDFSLNNLELYDVIVLTWSDSSGDITASLYGDGIFLESHTETVAFPNSSELLNIGGRPGADDRYLGGIMECFYVWDKVLSDNKVKNISDNPYQIFGRNLYYSEAAIEMGMLFHHFNQMRH